MADYNPRTNSSKRPASKFDAARCFMECVSCGAYKVLSEHSFLTGEEAIRRAHLSGWTVGGAKGAKATRCSRCRAKGRRDRTFADTNPLYGSYSRGNPLMRPGSAR